MSRIKIDGRMCDTEKEPGRCIEKMWDYIGKLESTIGRLESNNDDHMLENRVDDLESELETLKGKKK